MASSKLTKFLYTHITKLKLLDKNDAEVRYRLQKSPFDGIEDPDDLAADKREEFLIIGQIFPKSEIYGERSYLIEMKLLKTFPGDPPVVRFLTPIYHLNVGTDGTFCSVLLEKTAKWTPDTSLVQVIETVVNCIDHPDLDYAISLTMGTEYKDNRPDFNRKALEHVRKHGLPRE